MKSLCLKKRGLRLNLNPNVLQNDFSFEKRDWMSVNPEELPNGSQLVRGKNLGFIK